MNLDINIKKELIAYLSEYVTENKKEKIDAIIQDRTRYVTVVLEDLFHPHNASAVSRSADCFGVQDIHIIEKRHTFSPTHGVAKGATKWIDFYKYKDTKSCYEKLKQQGYRIVATTPHKRAYSLSRVPIDQKVALVFGAEALGLTQEAFDLADDYLTIPMYGFTESFNISVSTAVCLYDITQRLRESDVAWNLSEQDLLDVKLSWIRSIVKSPEALEKRFFEKKSK